MSDSELSEIYRNSHCLIAASYCEGFGLPLIEASLFEIPIIARDIPVFKEIASDSATYFPNDASPDQISVVIERWTDSFRQGIHVKSSGLSYLTWEESCSKLVSLIDSL